MPDRAGGETGAYYGRSDEENRRTRGSGLLEFARIQDILHRFLPPPPKVVLDVGGGSGPYSCWLARDGYETHLVDPVPKHLDQAHRASTSQPAHPIASIREGDARSLDQDDESVDVVLLMGPLYHLTSREDRIKALGESNRVLRVGGLVVAKAINRFASLFDGLTSGHIDDPSFIPILEHDLDEGQHRNPEGHEDYFTTAFFHRPEELEAEVRDAGFTVKELVAVQGPSWLAKDFSERWSDSSKRAELLRLIRMVEGESSLLGVSQHFVVLGQK